MMVGFFWTVLVWLEEEKNKKQAYFHPSQEQMLNINAD